MRHNLVGEKESGPVKILLVAEYLCRGIYLAADNFQLMPPQFGERGVGYVLGWR